MGEEYEQILAQTNLFPSRDKYHGTPFAPTLQRKGEFSFLENGEQDHARASHPQETE